MNTEREQRMMDAAKILSGPIDKIHSDDLDRILTHGNVQGAFICGVHWADKNPESPWINIGVRMPEDSLPNLSNTDRRRKRIKTILLMKDGRIMEGYRWMTNDGTWYWNIPICMRDEITHWMPVPARPQE